MFVERCICLRNHIAILNIRAEIFNFIRDKWYDQDLLYPFNLSDFLQQFVVNSFTRGSQLDTQDTGLLAVGDQLVADRRHASIL